MPKRNKGKVCLLSTFSTTFFWGRGDNLAEIIRGLKSAILLTEKNEHCWAQCDQFKAKGKTNKEIDFLKIYEI